MMSRHPTQQQLTSWLAGDRVEFDEHIDGCEKCARRLDKLDSDNALGNVEPITADLRPALLELLRPPEDLHERISARITERLQDRSDANLFGSLLGIPLEAGRVFLEPKDPDN